MSTKTRKNNFELLSSISPSPSPTPPPTPTPTFNQPNSIVLFFFCHGVETENLKTNLNKYLTEFGVNDKNTTNILKHDVKLTLSSAASVSSFRSSIVNPIGQQVRFGDLQLIEDEANIIQYIDTVYSIDFTKDIILTSKNYFILRYTLVNDNDIKTIKNVFRLASTINFDLPHQEVKSLLERKIRQPNQIAYLSREEFNSEKDYLLEKQKLLTENELFYEDLIKYLSFFKMLSKIERKGPVLNIVKNNPLLTKYNYTNIAAINEMIQFYCIDNPDHRITDAMYYHSKQMIKYMFDSAWTKKYSTSYLDRLKKEKEAKQPTFFTKFVSFFQKTKVANDEEEEDDIFDTILTFGDHNNEKIIDVTMDQQSYDRNIGFSNSSNPTDTTPYGNYLIKAFHNGVSYCSAVNNNLTQDIKDAESRETFVIFNRALENVIVKKCNVQMPNRMIYFHVLDTNGILSYDDIHKLNGDILYLIGFTDEDSDKILAEKEALIGLGKLQFYVLYGENQHVYENEEFLLNYHNPFIKRIVDNMSDQNISYKIIQRLEREHFYLSEIIAICKALGFEKIYISDASCRPIVDENKLGVAMRPSPMNYKTIRPDEPMVGDLVNFRLPKSSKWSSVPGKIIRKSKAGYVIDTSHQFKDVTQVNGRPTLGSRVSFVDPETGIWNKDKGVITKVRGGVYDVDVIKEPITKVTKVEDYIKMRSWFGGGGILTNNNNRTRSTRTGGGTRKL